MATVSAAGALAAILAASAAGVAAARGDGPRRLQQALARQRDDRPGGVESEGAVARADRRADRAWLGGVGVAAAALAGPVHEAGLATAVAVVGGTLVLRRRLRRRALSDAALRRAAGPVFPALAAELRVGRSLAAALAAAAADAPPRLAVRLGEASRELVRGGEAGVALLASGDPVAHAVLRPLAAASSVTATGAALAPVVDRLAQSARADQRLRDSLDAELAGPRASAALLAVLPLFGIALGLGIGARPVHLLFHTPLGVGCLLAGALLDLAGVLWARQIVVSAAGR